MELEVFGEIAGSMVMITLRARQQKSHRCIEQSFGLVGEGKSGMIWENGMKHV